MNLDDTLISIILPVFNGERFLSKSIESCLLQTHRNLEIIVVYDHSTDSTLEICQRYAKKDPRVKLIINEKKLNLPASLNVGYRAAKGEFLSWTSDDDFYESNAIEIMFEAIQKEGVDVVHSDFNLIDSNGKIKFNNVKSRSSSILFGNIIGPSFLHKRDVFKRNRGYDEDLHTIEDYDFWLQASKHSSFLLISQILYNKRTHEQSLTTRLRKQDKQMLSSFEQRLERSYSKFFSSFNIREKFYSHLFRQLHFNKYIDILEFLKRSKAFAKDMEPIYNSFGEKTINRELYIRLRSVIYRFPENQNLQVLLQILRKRPALLMKFDKKRSVQIVVKCLT